jgi:hypothetical protein
LSVLSLMLKNFSVTCGRDPEACTLNPRFQNLVPLCSTDTADSDTAPKGC